MILIAGSTGTLGYEICSLLVESGKKIRALVRDSSNADKIGELESIGAELVYGDLKIPNSLNTACIGVDTVISTVSSILATDADNNIGSVDAQGQLNLVEAAKLAGVSHFLYTSFPETPISFPLQDAKRKVEEALKASKMTYTILQPTNFMEVWFSPALGFDVAGTRATIYGSGENALSWISLKDVAKFAARSVKNPAALNATLKLGGPESLTYLQVISIFEDVTGKTFTTENVPDEILGQQLASASDSTQKSFAGLMLATSAGNNIPMDEAVRDFQMNLTSVDEYARSVVR